MTDLRTSSVRGSFQGCLSGAAVVGSHEVHEFDDQKLLAVLVVRDWLQAASGPQYAQLKLTAAAMLNTKSFRRTVTQMANRSVE